MVLNAIPGTAGYDKSRHIIDDTYWPGYVERYTERNSETYARKNAGREGKNSRKNNEGNGNRITKQKLFRSSRMHIASWFTAKTDSVNTTSVVLIYTTIGPDSQIGTWRRKIHYEHIS